MVPPLSPAALLRWCWGVSLVLVTTSTVLRLVDPGLGTDDLTVDDPEAGTVVGDDRPAPPFDGFYRLRDLLSVDAEGNLATWFSVALLLGSALVAWTLAAGARRGGDGPWRAWAVVALGLGYLSLDELAQLHEVAATLLGVPDLGGALTFGWVVVAAPAVLVAAVVGLRFAASLPPRTRALVVTAGAVYVGGALGMEVAGGAVYAATGSLQTVGYVLVSSLEELLELAGASLLLHALVAHLAAVGDRSSGGALLAAPAAPAPPARGPAAAAPREAA